MRYRTNRRQHKGVLIKHQRSVYLYWYKFLQFAVQSGEKVKWSKYKLWKINKNIVDIKFDEWWEEGQYLFQIKESGDTPKVQTSTKDIKPGALKNRFRVMELKYKGLTHKEIMNKLNNFKSPSGTSPYAINSEHDSATILSRARKHLRNVCNGIFP